ncbi:hypothetical protein A2W14_02725 [Candidatus Gottesmanbacteria bacterium RBG_16_37_8]|uniref:Cohesin domain-containing protein n=1 Tax=Candidatus Gottesmanbacteria bacterium RBG_16_37_8 TaxID=1798371 RepID=A0A1F5YPX3_9BACT|nr:MAG: hypothetical protein A2W14_02725 [Candidatus Gottesmanbacteria bacterium RBG_16_37_8]
MLKNLLSDQKKKIKLIIVLLLFLPVLIYATKLVQNMQKQAAGSNEVDVKFNPSTASYSKGDNISLKMVVQKTSQRSISISGVQAVFNVGNEMNVNNVSCLSPFTGLPFVRINSQQVTVFCAIGPGASPVALTSQEISFALVNITVKPDAMEGTTYINFEATRVTETGSQATDVSTGGITGQYTIVMVARCPRGELGNLDCSADGCIDTADFELFRQAFGKGVNEITVPDGQSTPDLVVDAFNSIDTADYEILRSNFGSCQ